MFRSRLIHFIGALAIACILGAPSQASAQSFLPAVGHQSHIIKNLVRRTAAPTKKLKVVVISDLNSSYGSTHYHKEVHEAIAWITSPTGPQPDLVLSTGDHVAGMKKGLDYEAMWQSFHRVVSTPLQEAGIPFAPTPGNHDATSRRGYEAEREEYKKQWENRRPEVNFVDTSSYPMRYAFMQQGVLFVSLDATTTGKLSTTQKQWLGALLERHNSVRTKIVFGHMPLHPVAKGREAEIMDDPGLEGLLKRHRVSAYLSGHHHVYYPGRRGALRLVHLSCLGGGPRVLQGGRGAAQKGLVVMEIDAKDGIISLEGFRGDAFQERVPRHTLPRHVGEGEHRIWRDDQGSKTAPVK